MSHHKTLLFLLFTAAYLIDARAQDETVENNSFAKKTTRIADIEITTEYPTSTTTTASTEEVTSGKFETTWTHTTEGKSSKDDIVNETWSPWQSTSSPYTPEVSSTWRPPETNWTTSDHGDTNEVISEGNREKPSLHLQKTTNSTAVSEEIDDHHTEEMPTEGTATVEEEDDEWANVEDCVLSNIECVEPVRCKGKGKINCSLQEKLPWMSDDFNASLLDLLLPKEPRVKRAFNIKLAKDRKRYQANRNKVFNTQNQDEDDDVDKEPCWTDETLLCTSELNLVNCRGTGKCDVGQSDESGSKALADWEIAVIAVLTLAGVLLAGLLVYVIYGA